jgi:hypothetical protein
MVLRRRTMSGTSNGVALACLILSVIPAALDADLGWWSRSRLAGGPLYSVIEHPQIALHKEVLIYTRSGACEAHFLFRNTDADGVTVRVAFPVKVTIPLRGLSAWLEPGWRILRLLYGDAIQVARWPVPPIDPDTLDLEFQKAISWAEFERLNDEGVMQGYRLVDSLAITQDGMPVPVDSVFVEARVGEDGTLAVTFHFLLRLSFPPDRHATVVVRYSPFRWFVSTGSPAFTDFIDWRYILGTGRTWRGPIKELYVVIPDHLPASLPEQFTRVGEYQENALYRASDYEPRDEDEIDVAYWRFGQQYRGVVGLGETFSEADLAAFTMSREAPTAPAQSFVVVRHASSFLPDLTWVTSFLAMPVPRDHGFWEVVYPENAFSLLYGPPSPTQEPPLLQGAPTTSPEIGFGPLSLFDGIPESAWCMDGDGIGESVEFELREDVWGLAVYNGFKKAAWCNCATGTGFDAAEHARLQAIYENNSRVRRFHLRSADGQIVHPIDLRDTSVRQTFEHVYLPRGVYTLRIAQRYEGARWNDTCLGEVEFFSASASAAVAEDEFLAGVLGRT